MAPLPSPLLELLYVVTIAVGLPVSTHVGEAPVNVFCISLFLFLFWYAPRRERVEMIAVLAFAIPMELFFSEVWKIYEYRRDLMPLYVPVGHWFVFDLGRRVADVFGLENRSLAFGVLAPFVPFTLYMAYTGVDTSGLVLLGLMVVFVAFGPAPMLYASMGWMALFMELWGTNQEVWEWKRVIPWTSLTAYNPPILVGAFYGLGDMLVNLATDHFAPEVATTRATKAKKRA